MTVPQNNRTKRKGARIAIIILCCFLSLAIVLCVTASILISVGKKRLLATKDTSLVAPSGVSEFEENDGRKISYNGKKYIYNENITNILIMGIDRENLVKKSGQKYGSGGQADVIFLLALDTSNGSMKAIPISRDTLAEINLFSTSGQYLGVSREQICLSYSYGDGREKSCENTVSAVSRLLYGMPINSYVSLDIDAIKILNDAVGGVTVTVDEDIDLYTKHVKKGEAVTLKGEYALKYIRSRDQSVLESNSARMARQKKYIQALFKTIMSMTKKDITTPIKLYNKVSNYKISNLNIADISFLTKCVLLDGNNQDMKFVSIPGQISKGEKYAEFIADENKLYDIIVDTFYIPAP